MIRTENLTKDYGNDRGIFDVNLEIPKGEIYGFIGPNGAGKTTTIKALCGLLKPSSGKAFVGDVEVKPRNNQKVKRLIGYMPDKYGVYEQMSVWEYLDFFCAAFRIPSKHREARIRDALKLTESEYMLDYRMGSLSHGMNKRIALARTLLHDPQIVIMDEPANGLDPHGRIEMRNMIKRLREYGKTILLSSHILPELSSVCDRVGIIEKGRLMAQGTVKEIVKGLQEQIILSIMVGGKAEEAAQICREFENVQETSVADNELRIIFNGTREMIADLNAELVKNGISVFSFKEEEGDLEEVFLQVTGRQDAGEPEA
ncbi:MAG: ABC transporter ATP-binding protein [Lentisphaeria bacterium]